MKKRRKSVARPTSGYSLSRTQYERLLKSYFEHRSIQQASTDACVSIDTARKYIITGSPKFPAIRERVEVMDRQLIEEENDAFVRHRKRYTDMANGIASKIDSALKSMVVVPKGYHITDDEGQVVRNSEGAPIMAVDEATLRQLIGSVRDLVGTMSEIAALGQAPSGSGGSPVNVNVGVKIDREAVLATFKDSARGVAGSGGVVFGTDDETRMRAVVKAEAAKRALVPSRNADN